MKRIVWVVAVFLVAVLAHAQDTGLTLGPTVGYTYWNRDQGTVDSVGLLTSGLVFDAKLVRAKFIFAGQIGPSIGSIPIDSGFSFFAIGLDLKYSFRFSEIFGLTPFIGVDYLQFVDSKLTLNDGAKENLAALFAVSGIGFDIYVHKAIVIGIYSDFGFAFSTYMKNTSAFPYKIGTAVQVSFRF